MSKPKHHLIKEEKQLIKKISSQKAGMPKPKQHFMKEKNIKLTDLNAYQNESRNSGVSQRPSR
jgi:hypothetical protein